jgi:hypothetical protein
LFSFLCHFFASSLFFNNCPPPHPKKSFIS